MKLLYSKVKLMSVRDPNEVRDQTSHQAKPCRNHDGGSRLRSSVAPS